MILYQNDYVILDVDKTVYNPETTDNTGGDVFRELIFNFTIQCNGKLRRTVFTAVVNKLEESDTVCRKNVNGYYIKDYQIIYNAFQMLHDLGYDVPYDNDIHPIVDLALENNFS